MNKTNERMLISTKDTLGKVTLAVRDLDKLTDYYQHVIGLALIDKTRDQSILGVDNTPLVELSHRPLGVANPYATGLYHLAILLPGRPDLALWVKHLAETDYWLDGVGDHLVSEALYLSDPEGNGIEIYRDRPKAEWQYKNGEIVMSTLSIDLDGLVAEAPDRPFTGLPDGTKMGHVHLQVDEIAKTRDFYSGVLGMDVMVEMPTASFLSVGGYHHHLGMNVWRSNQANPLPEGALGLVNYQIRISEDIKDTERWLNGQGISAELQVNTLLVTDPAGIQVQLIPS